MSSNFKSLIDFYKRVYLLFLFFLFLPLYAYGATISITNINAKPGDDVSVDINFSNDGDSVSAMNFDFNYDDTRLILNDIIIGAAGTSAGKVVEMNSISPGLEKVIIYGLNYNLISDGVVLNASFTVRDGATDGDAAISFSNTAGATGDAQSVSINGSSGIITIDSEAPIVTIDSPLDGDSFGRKNINVAGTVDDLSITEVDVNGQIVNVSDGSFSIDIDLVEGDNPITVKATDSIGNETIVSIIVHYLNGDINEDGVVDNNDVSILCDQILGILSITLPADANNDGNVNVIDLQLVINKIS